MRDHYRKLFARRRPLSDAEPETELIPPAVERGVQAAFPCAAVSDALRAQVAHICREAVEVASPERRPSDWNRRGWMRIARWGTLGLAAAVMAAIWMGNRPGNAALAATIRAMEAVPVIHLVSKGDKGGRGEIWLVDGVGAYLHSVGRDREEWLVDDLTCQYRSLIPRRPDTGITEARVEVVPSQMADPKQKRQIWSLYTKAGMLKELQSQKEHGKAQLSWVNREGRRLLRIHTPDPYGGTTYYSDPATDRILWYDTHGPDVLTHPERIRYTLDYPSLESVDRSLFRYEVPAGMVVWDQTEGPTRWAKGDQAACVNRIKEIREALRRYANAHGGWWPEKLRPALDSYLAPQGFHCPLAGPETAPVTSYKYERPGELLAGRILQFWNRRKADPSDPEVMADAGRLMSARPALLECRHHGKTVFSLYADGSVHRWDRQLSQAPAMAEAPAGPARVDPRAAAVLKAWEERERRLSEVMVTYDDRATFLVEWNPSVPPGYEGRANKQGPGDFMNARITWARKGRKTMRDERTRLPKGTARMRWVSDGDAVLLQSAYRPGEPLSAPSAQSSANRDMYGPGGIGLFLRWGRVADVLKRPDEIRYLGTETVGRDRCMVLELTERPPARSRSRLWLDQNRGYLPRRWEDYRDGRLQMEGVATGMREWAPGVFLSSRVTQLGYLDQDPKSRRRTHRWTTVVRDVVIGDLPDRLFQPVSGEDTAARPGSAPRKQAKVRGRTPGR